MKSWYAKATAIFAVVLLVSLGLCGLNILALNKYGAIHDGTPSFPRSEALSRIFMPAAFAELAGMVVGAGGLLVVGLVAIVRLAVRLSSKRSSDSASIMEKDKEP